MNDLTLFDVPAGQVRHSDPQTSRDAAARISGRTERLILETFVAKREAYPSLGDHGMTDDELCDWLPTIYSQTVKSARSRLSNDGHLVESGRTRLSNRGCPMIVWTAS